MNIVYPQDVLVVTLNFTAFTLVMQSGWHGISELQERKKYARAAPAGALTEKRGSISVDALSL